MSWLGMSVVCQWRVWGLVSIGVVGMGGFQRGPGETHLGVAHGVRDGA
jgi:hypothetical protein